MITTKIQNVIRKVYRTLNQIVFEHDIHHRVEVSWNEFYEGEGLNIRFLGYMSNSFRINVEITFTDDDFKYEIYHCNVVVDNDEINNKYREMIRTTIETQKAVYTHKV